MRFPDLLVEFLKMQERVALLITDVEQLRRELSAVTPDGDYQTLVSRETKQLKKVDYELAEDEDGQIYLFAPRN